MSKARMKMKAPKAKFGELIVKAGIITEAQLAEALQIQADEGPRRNLGEILICMGACDAADIDYILEIQNRLRNGGLDLESMVQNEISDCNTCEKDAEYLSYVAGEMTRQAKK